MPSALQPQPQSDMTASQHARPTAAATATPEVHVMRSQSANESRPALVRDAVPPKQQQQHQHQHQQQQQQQQHYNSASDRQSENGDAESVTGASKRAAKEEELAADWGFTNSKVCGIAAHCSCSTSASHADQKSNFTMFFLIYVTERM